MIGFEQILKTKRSSGEYPELVLKTLMRPQMHENEHISYQIEEFEKILKTKTNSRESPELVLNTLMQPQIH